MANQGWLLWSNQYEFLDLIINKMGTSTCGIPPLPPKKALCLMSLTVLIKSDWSVFPNFIHPSKLKLAVCSSVTCNTSTQLVKSWWLRCWPIIIGEWSVKLEQQYWSHKQESVGKVTANAKWLWGTSVAPRASNYNLWVWSYVYTYVHTHCYEG